MHKLKLGLYKLSLCFYKLRLSLQNSLMETTFPPACQTKMPSQKSANISPFFALPIGILFIFVVSDAGFTTPGKTRTIMNKRNFLFSVFISSLLGAFLTTGCDNKKQNATLCNASQVETLSIDTTVYVREGNIAPSCKLELKLAFLAPSADSTAMRINHTILRKAFGPAYASMTPQAFMAALKDTLISYHRTDISEFLAEDLKNGISGKDIPAWYNYEYDLESTLTAGMSDSIWNYVLTDFRQTGGAHPNTIETYLNIDATSGKVLTKQEVFAPQADKALEPIIIKALADYLNGLEGQDFHVSPTLQGLREAGLFLETDPYIPENFKLGKDAVYLYYNRYEIASYAAGDFEVKIPLTEAKKYIVRHNKQK